MITKANLRGYLDYKHLYYGNQESGPLSLKVTVKNTGYIYLCEGPSVFGKLASGFTHLWESSVEIYKTDISEKLFHQLDLVNQWTQYSFDKGGAFSLTHFILLHRYLYHFDNLPY